MLDLGTSDPVFSDQSAHEPFSLWHEEVGTQELTLQIATMGFFMTSDIMLNEWRANVGDERPEFTPFQRNFVTSIPGAGQYTVSRDDGGMAWRGKDINGKRTTLYFPRICSMEFKKAPTDCFPQVAAQLEGLFLETALFAAMDFDDPESINLLTEKERTMYVYNQQGVNVRWYWATFTEDWIRTFLGNLSPAGRRERITEEPSQQEQELPSHSDEDSQGPGPGSDEDRAMVDVQQDPQSDSEVDYELEELDAAFLRIYCTRPLVFTQPDDRFETIVNSQICLKFAEVKRVMSRQAVIPLTPPPASP